jgi:stage V sporulation protein B
MPAQSFIQGAITLLTAGVMVKALGFIYQMVMVRLIGSEAIGVFNMVYPVYSMALVLTTAGIPAAIVRMIPEHRSQNKGLDSRTLLRVGTSLLIISSTIIAYTLILIGPWLLRKIYNDPRVVPPFLFLVPTLLLISVSSAIRAYFQGNQDMRSTAGAQLLEQITRLVSGIGLAFLLAPYGLVWAITALALAVLASELTGFFYLWHYFIKNTKERSLLQAPHPALARSMYRFGLPLTATKVLLTASGALEAMLIPARLQQAGFSLSQAASLYGELTGVAFPLLNIPALITISMSTALIPTITEAQAKHDYSLMKRRCLQALGFTLAMGIPAALILFTWGDKVIWLIFKVANAGLMVRCLAFAGIFLWITQISSGILQGLGLVVQGSLSTLTACLLRLAFLYHFTDRPQNMIQGICLSYGISFVINSVINLSLITSSIRKTYYAAVGRNNRN